MNNVFKRLLGWMFTQTVLEEGATYNIATDREVVCRALLDMGERWPSYDIRRAMNEHLFVYSESVHELLEWSELALHALREGGYIDSSMKRKYIGQNVVLDDYMVDREGATLKAIDVLPNHLKLQLEITDRLNATEISDRNLYLYYRRTLEPILHDAQALNVCLYTHLKQF